MESAQSVDTERDKKAGQQAQSPIFYVADWYVDTTSNRVSVADTEEKLEAKVMAVLAYLAQRPGKIVSRQELETAIWKDTIVSYDALTSCIRKLRQALRDNSRQPSIIETVSKKGYRLIAPVRAAQAPELPVISSPIVSHQSAPRTPPLHSKPYLWLLAVVIVVSTMGAVALYKWPVDKANDVALQQSDLPSIVILPFENLSRSPQQDYLSDGLTVDLTTALSKLSGLFVIAPYSAMNYQQQAFDIERAGSELGVRYIFKGSLRRSGNRLRVNTQLIDGHQHVQLWAEQYDLQMKEMFEMQDDITEKIVAALAVTLTADEKRRTAQRYTTSIEAYDKFLQAQSFHSHNTPRDNQQARELFKQAIELDPNFARAYSGLALTYLVEYRYKWGDESAAALDIAVQQAQKAASLDSQLPQVYWVLGHIYLFRHEHRLAIQTIEQAIELDPNYADSYITLAQSYIYIGDIEPAIELIRKAMRLNPQYSSHYSSSLGQAYYFSGRYDDATAVLRTAIEKNPNLLPPRLYLIATLNKLAHHDDAKWEIEQLRILNPQLSTDNVAEMLPFSNSTMLSDVIEQLTHAGL